MSELREVNLELGMPTVQTALSQLALELRPDPLHGLYRPENHSRLWIFRKRR